MNPCSFCSANCCKSYVITATAFDILRISAALGKPAEDIAVLHQARLLAFDPDTTLDMEDDSWVYILGLKSHPCGFLAKDNKCAIRGSSPMACRRFPFTLAGTLNTRFCPLVSQLIFRLKGPDIPTEAMVQELEMHKKLVEEWNRKPGKKAGCVQFLLRRAREIPSQKSYTPI